MQFPHAGHMAAHWTAVYPPHFSIWQPHWAPAAVAPNWLPLISRSGEKQSSSCLFWSKWIIHGKGRATCVIAVYQHEGSSSETRTQACKTVTQQNFPLRRTQCRILPLEFHFLNDSRQLRLDLNLTHMPCLAWLIRVCTLAQMCVCVHAVEVVQSSKSRWFWILPGCSSDHVHPWGDPCVHGKVTTPFQTGIPRVCAAASENSNTFPTWGAPCVTPCRLKSVMLAWMLFCCQQLPESHFWDCGVPPLMIQP